MFSGAMKRENCYLFLLTKEIPKGKLHFYVVQHSKVYLEPRRTSMMGFFSKIIKKNSVIDVQLDSKYNTNKIHISLHCVHFLVIELKT